MATKDEIVKILGVLAAAYPGFNLQPQTITIYAGCLADMDADLLEQATKMVMTTSRFFPTIAELREQVFQLTSMATGLFSAEEAWNEVQTAIRRNGHTIYGGETPKMSSELLDKVVAIHGWNELCLSETPIEIQRAQFVKTYNALLERSKREMAYLPETRRYAALPDPAEPGDVRDTVRQLTARLTH